MKKIQLKTLAAALIAAMMLPVIGCASAPSGQTSTQDPLTPSFSPTATASGDDPSEASFSPVSSASTVDTSSSGAVFPEDWRDTGELSKPVTVYGCSEELSSMTDIQLARYAAAEGMVLLKNENEALPLAKGATVALFGEGQIKFVKGGSGSGDVNALYTVNLSEGMREKAKEQKIVLDETLAAQYERTPKLTLTDKILSDAAAASDNAVVVISRTSGENVDLNASQFTLSSSEVKMLSKITGAGFKHVIVVLNIGAVMSTAFLDQFPQIDALLICWQPGMEGGNATADVLCGDVNPSGKLVDTIAKTYGAYPSSPYFGGSEYAVYTEDIFVGYRYFETFDPEYTKVAFPFGYGLSYTTFDLSEPFVREDQDNIEVQILVANTGKRAGKQTVQVYFSAPKGKLGAPGKVLAGFAKTGLLQPGEYEKLTISFPILDMAMYDDLGTISRNAYVLEKGDYGIFVGDSIRDAGQRGVCFTHKEENDRVVRQLDGKIAPTMLKERLNAYGSMDQLDASGYTLPLYDGKTVFPSVDYLRAEGEPHFVSDGAGRNYGVNFSKNKAIYFNVVAPDDGAYAVTVGYGAAFSGNAANALQISCSKQKYTLDLSGTGGQFTRRESGEVVLELKKGANLVRFSVPGGFTESYTLFDVSFNDGKSNGVTDNRAKYQAQSEDIASGNKVDFSRVYEDPALIDEFLNSLSPAEMIELLIGHAANVGRGDGSIAGLTGRGVPYVDLSDGPAGLDLAVKQVAWPIETALGCSWDVSLLYAVGTKISEECYKAGVDVILGPGINIHRDPLGGRNFEYYSEDPLITGKMASAFTQGVQKKGTEGVMIKHFYANSRETGRVDGNSSISERAARMIYLRAFEICVKESSPVSIMTTYNLTNGIYNAENSALLEGVVRGEWGFEGFFCTDWGSHSENPREISAGNDVKMSWGDSNADLAAYRCGYLTLEQLRLTAKRVLLFALRCGSMDRMLHPVIPVHEIKGTTRIKAAEMATRSPGIGFEECSDEDGGINPNYMQGGREVTYSLNVTEDGTYSMRFRVATENENATFYVFLDGERVGTVRQKDPTGGWQVWTTLDASKLKMRLSTGEHELKFRFSTALNINWFELVKE